MPKFRILLERVDTVTRQAVLLVDAESADAAQGRIMATLQADEGHYDGRLVEVDSGFGRMTVKVRGGIGDFAEAHRSLPGEFNGNNLTGDLADLSGKR